MEVRFGIETREPLDPSFDAGEVLRAGEAGFGRDRQPRGRGVVAVAVDGREEGRRPVDVRLRDGTGGELAARDELVEAEPGGTSPFSTAIRPKIPS